MNRRREKYSSNIMDRKMKVVKAWWPLTLFSIYYVLMYCIPYVTGFDNAKYVRFALLFMVLIGCFDYYVRKPIVNDRNLTIFFGVFLVISLIGLLRNFSMTYMEVFVCYICCFLMLQLKHKRLDEELFKITNILLIFSIFIGITVIIHWMNPSLMQTVVFSKYDPIIQRYVSNTIARGSYTGIFTEVSITCSYLLLGFGISVYSRYIRKNIVRCLLIAFFLFSLLLTAKRAQTLFAILAIPMVYMLKSSGRAFLKKFVKVFFAITVGIVVLVVIVSHTNSGFFDRYVETIIEFASGSDITTGRTQILAQAFQLIAANPILGFGWGRSEYYITNALVSSISLGPHNLWIQLWADFGIIGVLTFGALFIYILISSVKLLRLCYYKKDVEYTWAISLCVYYILFTAMYSFFASPIFDKAYAIPFFVFVVLLFIIKRTSTGIQAGNQMRH